MLRNLAQLFLPARLVLVALGGAGGPNKTVRLTIHKPVFDSLLVRLAGVGYQALAPVAEW